MNTIIEDAVQAANLPSQTATQENNQAGDQKVETTAGDWETLTQEEAAAVKLKPKPEVIVVEAPYEAAVKPKIQTGMVRVALLRPYAKNAEIYQEREDALFTENIRKNGVLTDLVVTEDGETLGGNRRLREAIRLGMTEVPVKVVACRTEDEKMLRVLDDNVQRVKTNEEIAREYAERLKVEARAAALRKVEAGRKPKGAAKEVEKLTPPANRKAKARDEAAKAFKLSGVTAEKGRKVLEAVAKARAEGDLASADELLVRLNDEGFHSAFKRAESFGLIPKAAKAATKVKAATAPKAETPAVVPEADHAVEHPVGADADEDDVAVEDDGDADDAAVAAYVTAVAKLQNAMAEKLSLDQRKNLLRAHDDAQDWFGYNNDALHEER